MPETLRVYGFNLITENGRLGKLRIDRSGYEPLDIEFLEDEWSFRGSQVVRFVTADPFCEVFRVVFRSSGRSEVRWRFKVRFYGIVLPESSSIIVEDGARVYVPIYFHYDMVERRCERVFTIRFEGAAECILHIHVHRDIMLVNNFSGFLIIASRNDYRFPIAFLTLGVPPKPSDERLRLLHKYYTPLLTVDAIEALDYILERAPIKTVIAPKDLPRIIRE
ncbi:hypothetical protein DRN63_02965, partial [Nanoarchaeota archaeon]